MMLSFRKHEFVFLFLGFVLVFTSSLLLAQDARGRIIGLITDETGGEIPRATVTAKHLEMNTSSSALSNDAGNYELPYLLPGIYRIVVQVSGFKSYVREPIEVRAGDSISLPIRLEVGAISETVNVTAQAPCWNPATPGSPR